MRYIRNELLLTLIPNLIAEAEEARANLLREPDEIRRGEMVEGYRRIWVAFRPSLAQLSDNKCWYTESENPGTDDDVDHYRPKGRVAEDKGHTGYWWEALNWRNFRLSCHRANRLRENPEARETYGKGDHFPLLNEGDRCRIPVDDLRRERPLLLDPADPQDPPLLTFNIDGTVAVSPDHIDDPDVQRRVNASRIYLHLEWPRFKEHRQAIYREITAKVEQGQQHAQRFHENPADRQALKGIVRDLIALTADAKPYSRAASRVLKKSL